MTELEQKINFDFFNKTYKKKSSSKIKDIAFTFSCIFLFFFSAIYIIHNPDYIEPINQAAQKIKAEVNVEADIKPFSLNRELTRIDNLIHNDLLKSEEVIGEIVLKTLNNKYISLKDKETIFKKYSQNFLPRISQKKKTVLYECKAYDPICHIFIASTKKTVQKVEQRSLSKVIDYHYAINATANILKIQPAFEQDEKPTKKIVK